MGHKEIGWRLAVVAYNFNPSTGGRVQVDLCEFEASLVYKS